MEDDDDDDDIAADIADHCIQVDERIINISNGPVDRSYAGSGDIM